MGRRGFFIQRFRPTFQASKLTPPLLAAAMRARSSVLLARTPLNVILAALVPGVACGHYPQFHIGPIGVQVQHGPKLPPL
jgi:hypothetical protein